MHGMSLLNTKYNELEVVFAAFFYFQVLLKGKRKTRNYYLATIVYLC